MDKPKIVKAEESILTSSKFDITTTTEGGGEYAMPDYYPEIRRVVSVSAQALPDTKFLSGDMLEYGGTLAFTVLYIGEDGALVCVPYACEYSGSMQLPAEVKGAADIAVDVLAQSEQCRVLAPRRISLKSRLRVRIGADDTTRYSCHICDADDCEIQSADRKTIWRLSRTVPVLTRGRAASTASVTGEMHDRAGTKPLSCAGTVNITEVKCQKDAIYVRGEIVLRCLTFNADGIYAPVRGRISFEESMPSEGALEGDRARAWGRVASVTVSEADDGNGTIHADAEYDLEGEWCRRSETVVADDAYSSAFEMNAERTDMTILSPLCCQSSALTISGSGRRESKPSANEYLIDMVATPMLEKAENADGKIIFTGSCAMKAMIASDGEVAIEEFSLPVKYECSADKSSENGDTIWNSSICCTDVNGRLDGDKIACTAELSLSVSAVSKAAMAPVTRMIINKNVPRGAAGAEIKVYYPASGETVWNIAKKYGAPVTDIERLNSVDRMSASDGSPLVIPCCREN